MTDWRDPFARHLARRGFGVDSIRRALALAEADVARHAYRLENIPIAAADILPYSGAEVRQWRDVRGIDKSTIAADAVYHLLKPAAELERAAPSFCGVPILKNHPDKRMTDDDIVGRIDRATFAGSFLMADVHIFDRAFADQIKSGALPCPSVSHAATTVMEPGDGYHGFMRDIKARHLIFCTNGRAGIRLPLAA